MQASQLLLSSWLAVSLVRHQKSPVATLEMLGLIRKKEEKEDEEENECKVDNIL